MNYLAIDYGEKRIGLAAGDSDLQLAIPIDPAINPTPDARIQHILKEIKRRSIHEIVIGYPYNMDGSTGFKAREVDAFITRLSKHTDLPIHRVDERLSSQQATSTLTALQGNSRKRKSPKQTIAERKSGGLDSRAAAIILQDFLDTLQS